MIKKRSAIICNRCTVEFFSPLLNDYTSPAIYCEECLTDFKRHHIDVANITTASLLTEDEELGDLVVISADEETETPTAPSCLFCDTDLSHLQTEHRIEEHIRDCINTWHVKFRAHDVDGNECGSAIEDSERSDLCATVYYCIICDVDISKKGLLNRALHLKRCAKENKIATKDLLSLLEPIAEPIDVDDDDDDDDNEFNASQEEKDNLHAKASVVSSSTPIPNDKTTSPKKNAWEVLMAASANSTTGFARKADNNRTRSLPASSSSSSAITRTTSSNNGPADMTLKSAKPFKRNRWGSSNSSSRSVDGQPAEYVPAYKKVQAPNMTHPVIVDGFQFASKSLSDCYFLTHFHSDHYTGLTRSFSYGTIYCSPATAALVRLHFKIGGAVLMPLLMEKKYEIKVGGASIEVVLMDANHCPGAVCILFTLGNGKKVLHTGDFRWNNELCARSPAFKSLASAGQASNMRNLTVYLDTTYCDATYTFPAQHVVISEVVSVVRKEAVDDGVLFVFGAYTIGKERLFMAVAEDIDSKVYVDNNRWKTILCFDWPMDAQARLTKEAGKSRVWVVNMNQINFNHLTALQKKKAGCSRVVAFLPTGWTHASGSGSGGGGAKRYRDSNTVVVAGSGLHARHKDGHSIYSVPYSEHSSFNELIDFIKMFCPHRVIPTVNTSVEKVKAQVELLKSHSGVYGRDIAGSNDEEGNIISEFK